MDLEMLIPAADPRALLPRALLRGALLPTLLLLAGCGGGDVPADQGAPPPQRSPSEWAALPASDFCREALAGVAHFLGAPGEPGPRAVEHVVRHGGLPDGTDPDRPGERFGGTAVVGSVQELRDGLNGFFGTHYRSAQHQLYVGLMPLVRRGAGLAPEPWLAESWVLGEDGTTLTFLLREDVVWHDGTPVTPADVVFTYLRARDPRTGSPRGDAFQEYLDTEEAPPMVEGRSVTFRINPQPEPLAPWLIFPPMPAHLLGEVPPDLLRAHPFGTRCPLGNGPFVFVEHRQDERWAFRANPAFPPGLGGRPYLDGYVYRVVPEAATLLTELLTAGVDLVPRLSLDHAARVEEDGEVTLLSTPGTSYLYVAWNSRREVLADPQVRQALTLGMDRPGILGGIRGGRGVVAATGIPPSHPGWAAPREDLLGHDPERAALLLDEAGWRRDGDTGPRLNGAGERLSFVLLHDAASQEQGDIALRVQATLGVLGVEVQLRSLEFGTLLSQAESTGRDFDALIMSSQPDYWIDESPIFHSRYRDTGPYAWSGVADPELDALLDSLAVTGDPAGERELWGRYQERLQELQPYTWLYLPDWLTGVRSRLQGVVVDTRGEWAGITGWWIPGGERR